MQECQQHCQQQIRGFFFFTAGLLVAEQTECSCTVADDTVRDKKYAAYLAYRCVPC